METFTSVNKLNYEHTKQQDMLVEDLEAHDIMFYDSLKMQLDGLNRNPSDETVSRILAYSRSK